MVKPTLPRIALLACAVSLAACATKPPRVATEQPTSGLSKPYKVGGSYDDRNTQLTLMINGEPAMRGSFPPYTPTLNLSTDYRGAPARAECYFSSILSSRGGRVGIIAGAVQSGQGKTGDTCKVFLENKEAALLQF